MNSFSSLVAPRKRAASRRFLRMTRNFREGPAMFCRGGRNKPEWEGASGRMDSNPGSLRKFGGCVLWRATGWASDGRAARALHPENSRPPPGSGRRENPGCSQKRPVLGCRLCFRFVPCRGAGSAPRRKEPPLGPGAHRKFSTSMMSLSRRSTWVYANHSPPGPTARLCTGLQSGNS